jgi:hypothetical protein
MINNQDDEKILDSITKEEIETIIKNMSRKDIEEWLKILRGNEKESTVKRIMLQIKAPLKANSKEVQKKFPGIIAKMVVDERDTVCSQRVMLEFSRLRQELENSLKDNLHNKYTVNCIKEFDFEDYRLFLEDIADTGAAFDPVLFFIQLKLEGISVPSELRNMVIQMWEYRKSLQEKKKITQQALEEQKNQYKDLNKAHQQSLAEQKELQKQIKTLTAKMTAYQEKNTESEATIKQQQEERETLQEKIKSLNEALEKERAEKNELADILKGKKTEYKAMLEKEYQSLIEKNGTLKEEQEDIIKNIKSLNARMKTLRKDMEGGDVSSKPGNQAMVSVPVGYSRETSLFVQHYPQPDESDIVSLVSTTGYIRYVATTMLNFVHTSHKKRWGKQIESVAQYFVYSRLLNLHPIFCGYGSLGLANSLIGMIDGERADVISIVPGFNDIASLDVAIRNASTKNVIITDGFGQMNEAVLMPILRGNYDKYLTFIAEDSSDMTYVPHYLMRYCLLIVFEGRQLNDAYQFPYGKLDNELLMWDCNPKGYEEFETILKSLCLDSVYLSTRRSLFNYAMSKENNGSDFKTAFQQYAVNELYWLLDEANQDKLKEYLMHNSSNAEVLNGIF